MPVVFVVDKNGVPLMPTCSPKARKLLKVGRAKIFKRRPFTIQLLDRDGGDTQPVEYCCDTGYQHMGVSIKSEKQEFVAIQFDLLQGETERLRDRATYRRQRRNRLRYRKVRFNNRKNQISKDGFPPSIRNRRDTHIRIFQSYAAVCPITSATFEMGQFDTQALKAIQEGQPLPKGNDYSHGERYGIETLREAVFTRDGHCCVLCGRSGPKNEAMLHVHHVGFWKGDRTNRLSNLATICERCHTAKNHQPKGKLYGWEPKLKNMADATYMTAVRFDMFRRLKECAPHIEWHMSYGAKTKLTRKELGLEKSHINDAYALGQFHPAIRSEPRRYRKRRRNNRSLEKFYDAKLIDVRTGEKVSGKDLGCNRTKRSIPRNNPENLRMYRGPKITIGHRNIRRQRYQIQPGDRIYINGKWATASGTHNHGTRVMLAGKSIAISKIAKIVHANGWEAIPV